MSSNYHEEEILGKAYDGRLMKRLLIYLKPYSGLVALSVIILLISSLAQLAAPYLTKIAIDKYIMAGDSEGLFRIMLFLIGTMAFAVTLEYFQRYLMQYIGQRAMYDLRMQIFSHVQHLDLKFFNKNPVGRILTRITSDVQVLNEMFTAGVIEIFGDIFMILGIIAAMLVINWKLALVVFSVLPLLVLTTVIFRKKVRQSFRDVRLTTARLNAFTQENLTGISVVQSFTAEERVFAGYDGINIELKKAHLRTVFYFAVFFPIVEIIGAFSLALIVGYGGGQILGGALTLGALVAFIQYADRFYRPIRDLSEKYNILQAAMASSERIFKLLDTNTGIELPSQPAKIEGLKGSIEFRDLSFGYEDNNFVLNDINLDIKAGEKIAVVGATGSGKTTLISLLCRFYEYNRGDILIDGISLKKINEKELRKNIALVLQDVFLFTGDINRNIRLGSEEISLEDVKRAACEIGADRFISRLDKTYEYQLTERGANLSVGQRQLIAFARALAFNPAILILDEATSSVDTETEILIQKALRKLLANRTSIVIAHRLSTIRDVDRIVVMHKSRIREVGAHEELMKAKGIYYRLYQLQYKDQEALIANEQLRR